MKAALLYYGLMTLPALALTLIQITHRTHANRGKKAKRPLGL